MHASSTALGLSVAISESASLYGILGMAAIHRYGLKKNGKTTWASMQHPDITENPVAVVFRYLSRSRELLQNKLDCAQDALSLQSVTIALILCSAMVNFSTICFLLGLNKVLEIKS